MLSRQRGPQLAGFVCRRCPRCSRSREASCVLTAAGGALRHSGPWLEMSGRSAGAWRGCRMLRSGRQRRHACVAPCFRRLRLAMHAVRTLSWPADVALQRRPR